MALLPVSLMLDRVERYGAESDSARFIELLYAGELMLKFTTAAFIAAIEDDRENQRYRLLHALVRADGVGSWSKALDEALTGPASQHLSPALADIRRQFTERCAKGAWQHTAVHDLRTVLQGVHDEAAPAADKVQLRAWFQTFSELRNKTRGHGAITPAACARLVPALEKSIRALATNNPIFHLEWAYLHRNLSGKYKVVPLSDSSDRFASLKSAAAAAGENYKNGVYLFAGGYRPVDLIYSNLDIADFFLPNGGFQNGTFELHSLLTDSRRKGDATPYLAVATDRPPSETEGQGELDVLENVFSNLPAAPIGYVRRPELEAEVVAALTNDRHPIVTLVGRGGIGKTSLALTVLRA